MSIPGKPNHFGSVLDGLVASIIIWVIIGGGSRFMSVELAGSYKVTSQSYYPRTVAEREQNMDAPCTGCVWMLVGSARGESLLVCRCLNLFVNCEPSSTILWKDERLDVSARGLLSPVMVIASESCCALPRCEFSFNCAADLPLYWQSTPPSTCVSDGDCFPVGF